jgi:hypothetical protein
VVAGGLHHRGAPVCDRRPAPRAQPGGQPVPGWHSSNPFGERAPVAVGGSAPPPPLVPHQFDPAPTMGGSLGRVVTRCMGDVEDTQQDGQRAASAATVTRCTTGQPSAPISTRSAPRPSRPNSRVVSLFTLVAFV